MAFWGKKPGDEEANVKEIQSAQVQTVTPQVLTPQTPEVSTAPMDQRSDPYSKVRSALGPGTVIQGRLSFDSIVSIDGKLSGEIFSSKALLVGKSGTIEAQVEVASLIIRGIVKGTIKATERIELRDGGQLIGDVITPVLTMEEGCVFNGSVKMGQAVQTAPFKSTEATKQPQRTGEKEEVASQSKSDDKYKDAPASSLH